MIASGSPQQAPQKKMSSAIVGSARGLPPPIPPNKPILPASALKERSKELQQSVSAKAKIFTSPKSTNLSMSPQGEKGKNTRNEPSSPKSVMNGKRVNNKKTPDSTKSPRVANTNVTNSSDINCKELVDFNQVLASMEQNDDASASTSR